MPARSKSQQRLFGMVHAYNKGEFHGSRQLRRMVANLSKRISGDDARHFAETPHSGLPERKEKKAGALDPAIFSRDVLKCATPRVVRDADGTVQVLVPRGNVPSDALLVAEREVSPLLAAWYAKRRSRTPSDTDLRRMYDVVQADARLFRRLKALGLVEAIRSGRAVRNRIVHQPGYVPSRADSERALRDYADAERIAGKSEKRAQVMIHPDAVQAMYARIEPRIEAMANRVSDRSRRRRSFLGNIVSGTFDGALWGSLVGGLGAGALGAWLASKAPGGANVPPDVLRSRLIGSGIRCGLWGAGKGAIAGSAIGLGVGAWNGIRE